MKRKGISIILAMVTIFCFCSCQPTPKDPVVKNKNDGKLMAIIRDTNEETLDDYSFPKELIDEYMSEKLSVSIHADIMVPDVIKYPVIQVESANIDIKQAKRIIEILIGDEQLYFSEAPSVDIKTKSQIEEEIILTKQRISSTDWLEDAGLSKEEMELRIEEEKEYLKELEDRYSDAPESIDLIPVDLSNQETLEGGLIAGGMTKDKRNMLCSYSINEDDKRYNMLTWFHSLPMGGKNEFIERTEEITKEEVVTKVNNFISEIGLRGFEINRVFSIEQSQINEKLTTQYHAILTRKYNEIPVTYTTLEQGANEADQMLTYTMPWFYEMMKLGISKDGIDFFQWRGCSSKIKNISENTKLLDFDSILNIFKQQIKNQASWIDDDVEIVSRKLYIDEIRLGYMRVNIKDRIDEYMMIPVWDFFGYTVDKYEKQQEGGWLLDENNEHMSREEGYSYLTINAIDGTIIDRNKGY